jgi:hypothetical protein
MRTDLLSERIIALFGEKVQNRRMKGGRKTG